ncbi:MAG: hypothetical protein IT212_07810 [Bacteroidia bacterium]|nr:hypothetical protein [Bacteroidia bacterium]
MKNKKINPDLVSHSLEEILTDTYGEKGTTTRTAADAKIKEISDNLESINKKKDKKDKHNNYGKNT